MSIIEQIYEDFGIPYSQENPSKSTSSIPKKINPNVDDLLSIYPELIYEYKKEKVLEEKGLMSYEEIIDKCRIGFDEEFEDDVNALEIVSKTGEANILGTLGNISLIKGKAKSRKSFLVNLIISSVLGKDESSKIRGSEIADKNILYFDTEQVRKHVFIAQNRIKDKANLKYEIDNLFTISLRKYTPYQRAVYVERVIKNTCDLGLVIIDGVKDLVTSINDERESTEVSSKLLKWSTEYNCHIIVVLHENPSNDKSRGHLGTELTNKAETVIQVAVDDKNSNVSVVRAAACRNKEFEDFAFEIVEELPHIIDGFSIDKKPSKTALNDLPDNDKYGLFTEVFKNNKEYKHSELKEVLRTMLYKGFKEIKNKGKNKITHFIRYGLDKGMILQDGNRQPYRLNKDYTSS